MIFYRVSKRLPARIDNIVAHAHRAPYRAPVAAFNPIARVRAPAPGCCHQDTDFVKSRSVISAKLRGKVYREPSEELGQGPNLVRSIRRPCGRMHLQPSP